MNIQPTLNGTLVALRPLKPDDYEDLFQAASDPLIWSMHPQPDRYKPEVFKIFFDEALKCHGALLISDIESGEVLGTSRYYEYSEKDSSVVIGYTFLVCKKWGGQTNWDLKKLMVNYGLAQVKTVFFHVGVDNKRSQAALAKIGATKCGTEKIPVSYAEPKLSYIYKITEPLL